MPPGDPKIGDQAPAQQKDKGKGLGREKNVAIAELLQAGKNESLLRFIQNEDDKTTTCEVILESMTQFNTGSRAKSTDSLIATALNDLDEYSEALKELILYAFRNNLKGGRFFQEPGTSKLLFLDDDAELVSMHAEVATHEQGPDQGKNYIRVAGQYEVLTGPKKGKIFEAGQDSAENYRPVKGPSMEEPSKE